MSRPKIVCAGMCDTKSAEMRFLADQVAAFGGQPIIMDLSLGGAVGWADVPLTEVLGAVGEDVSRVHEAPRADAINMVGHAAAKKIVDMHEQGECDGMISWAGSVGTTTVTHAMRALPYGVPKIMLTDMASSDVSVWMGNKDIYFINPTAEQGINIVTSKIVRAACAGIVAMAQVEETQASGRPLAAITTYGVTTPAVNRCAAALEDMGWDCVMFHAVGAGATMEDLVRDGMIGAVLDLTPGELTNNLFGSPYGTPQSWGGDRLTAASETGIPQIVVPGGLDQCAHGAFEKLPEQYKEDFRTGVRQDFRGSGMPYRHNDVVTVMFPTLEEVAEMSRSIAGKLNRSRGPAAFVIPMRGWSAYDQSEKLASRERGWSEGNGDGPTWQPDPDNPDWSRRAVLMREIMQNELDPAKVDLVWVDKHILDPEFSDLVIDIFKPMLDGSWQPGKAALAVGQTAPVARQ
ncbi:MAG: Tm-1-like ATP-binding domain-containing protein [Nitratireductor sp.]